MLAHGFSSAPQDPVAFDFAFFGCNRVDKDDWDPATNPSSANVPQLNRTFADVAQVRPVPRFLFAGGDLVMGYATDDGSILKGQLGGWADLVKKAPLPSQTEVVPIPGNHELNKKTKQGKLPNPMNDRFWTEWLTLNNFRPKVGNGPALSGSNADRLLDDQSRLSYSFDSGSVHFVVLNTDTRTTVKDAATGEGRLGWVPADWAAKDIQKAEADPKIRSIFVFGHRNLVDPTDCTGDAPIEAESGAKLLKAIQDNDKVRAYVCAHVHAWDVRPMGGKSNALQIVSGNGGSKLEPDWKPAEGTTFGFVVLRVHKSGEVGYVRYSRPTPPGAQKYFEASPVAPPAARPEPEVMIATSHK